MNDGQNRQKGDESDRSEKLQTDRGQSVDSLSFLDGGECEL